MHKLEFEGQLIPSDTGETVLDALLRNGIDVANGCRSGVCQACVLTLEDGELPPSSQSSLNDRQKQQNQFLSCQCRLESSIRIKRGDTLGARIQGIVVGKQWLNTSVMQLLIETDVAYLGGQYMTLWKDEYTARSYSIASVSLDASTRAASKGKQAMEFHIKHIPGGAFSQWCADSVSVGDDLWLQGPLGRCFYTQTEQPILLVGSGTGLAPLLGVLRSALAAGHHQRIELVLSNRDAEAIYLFDELNALAETAENLNIHWLIQDGCEADSDELICSDIYTYLSVHFTHLQGWQVYLCGSDTMVKKLRKQAFLSGAAMQDIAADSFLAFGA